MYPHPKFNFKMAASAVVLTKINQCSNLIRKKTLQANDRLFICNKTNLIKPKYPLVSNANSWRDSSLTGRGCADAGCREPSESIKSCGVANRTQVRTSHEVIGAELSASNPDVTPGVCVPDDNAGVNIDGDRWSASIVGDSTEDKGQLDSAELTVEGATSDDR